MKYRVGRIVNGMWGRIEIEGKNIFGDYFGKYTEVYDPLSMVSAGMHTGPMTEQHLDQFNSPISCPMEVQNEIQKR